MQKEQQPVKRPSSFMLKLIYLMGAANVLILFVVFFAFSHRLLPQYYSTSVNGKYQSLTALDMPNTSDAAVIDWASLAVISCYTMDFVNYQDQMSKVAIYFTDNGWYGFTTALQNSNLLDTVVAKKLVVNSVITKAPVIKQKGYLHGQYSWAIEIPLLVTYQAASDFSSENVLVNLLVTRASTLDSYKGLGIEKFIEGKFDIILNSSASLTQ